MRCAISSSRGCAVARYVTSRWSARSRSATALLPDRAPPVTTTSSGMRVVVRRLGQPHLAREAGHGDAVDAQVAVGMGTTGQRVAEALHDEGGDAVVGPQVA